MRILHVSAQKPDSTGSGVYLHETVTALARTGAEQLVIAGIAPEDSPGFPEGVGFRPVVFETERLPFPVVGMSDEMPYRATRYRDLVPSMVEQFEAAFDEAFDEALAQFAPDLIISHHLYLVTAHLAHRALPCPLVAICHSTDLRQFKKIPLERAYIREGIRRLSSILSLHDAQAAEIVETFGVPGSRVHVIGTGYNAKLFYCDASVERDERRIAYAGKIWEKKGVACLLRSFERMEHLPEGLVLELAGGHSDDDEYGRIVDLARSCPLEANFLGKLPQRQLARLYNQSGVFVLPSFFEGLPLVVVEALACGCKVVVTDLPGIRAWIEKNIADAPVWYVEAPAMRNADEPVPESLPAFEKRLATALEQALFAPPVQCDVTGLSWDALAERMLRLCRSDLS